MKKTKTWEQMTQREREATPVPNSPKIRAITEEVKNKPFDPTIPFFDTAKRPRQAFKFAQTWATKKPPAKAVVVADSQAKDRFGIPHFYDTI